MQKTNFEGKFLSKLSKIDKQEIEGFLSHLVREKNFLEIIFNALLDGIVVLRPSLQVLYTNNAAIDLLGLGSRRRIIGERITDLVQNEDFGGIVSRFALNRQPVSSAEFHLESQAGRNLAATIIPLEADADRSDGSVVMIVHDLTETKRIEEERRRMERITAFTTLAAGLAHEVKNPLNSLQIHAQLLQRALNESNPKKMDSARARQSSEIILEEIKRLGSVVNDFLTAVRPTKPMFQRGNINTLIERIAATVRPEAESRGIELLVSTDHDIPSVDFDPHQMTQAVLNLVKNALEAVEHVDNGHVELRTDLREATFRVTVRDNGSGIPEEELKKIFEPYFTTKFSGTGLGLAIVSRIVGEHGGEVEIFSAPGKGTDVTLVFPIESAPVRLLGETHHEAIPPTNPE